MAKTTEALIGILLLSVISTLTLSQEKEQKARIKFKSNIIHLNNNEAIKYRGDTIYVTFEYYNLNSPYPLSIEFVKPSCNCTGFKLTEPKKNRENGFIELVFTKSSIEQFGVIDAIVKSNAINDYELIEVVYK
jgi:hypothetical protein